MSETTLKLDGLEKLLKALGSARKPVVRVGILGAAAREPIKGSKTAPSNAQIGAWHEFGTSKSPVRSFLRMPLSEKLQKELDSSGALDKDTMQGVIKSGTVIPWLKKIAVLAEGIVADAFDTSGFGKWKLSNMSRKKVHQTLVETQQLRNSITSEVRE